MSMTKEQLIDALPGHADMARSLSYMAIQRSLVHLSPDVSFSLSSIGRIGLEYDAERIRDAWLAMEDTKHRNQFGADFRLEGSWFMIRYSYHSTSLCSYRPALPEGADESGYQNMEPFEVWQQTKNPDNLSSYFINYPADVDGFDVGRFGMSLADKVPPMQVLYPLSEITPDQLAGAKPALTKKDKLMIARDGIYSYLDAKIKHQLATVALLAKTDKSFD